MEGMRTVGGTTEWPMWPKPSEQGREWCHGRLVKEAGEPGSYRAVTHVRSPKCNGNHLDSFSRRMA